MRFKSQFLISHYFSFVSIIVFSWGQMQVRKSAKIITIISSLCAFDLDIFLIFLCSLLHMLWCRYKDFCAIKSLPILESGSSWNLDKEIDLKRDVSLRNNDDCHIIRSCSSCDNVMDLSFYEVGFLNPSNSICAITYWQLTIFCTDITINDIMPNWHEFLLNQLESHSFDAHWMVGLQVA